MGKEPSQYQGPSSSIQQDTEQTRGEHRPDDGPVVHLPTHNLAALGCNLIAGGA